MDAIASPTPPLTPPTVHVPSVKPPKELKKMPPAPKKKRWGKKQVDSSYADELRRQLQAEVSETAFPLAIFYGDVMEYRQTHVALMFKVTLFCIQILNALDRYHNLALLSGSFISSRLGTEFRSVCVHNGQSMLSCYMNEDLQKILLSLISF